MQIELDGNDERELSFEEERKLKINIETLQDQNSNLIQFESSEQNEMDLEDVNPKSSLTVQFILSILKSYENLIYNKLLEIEFESRIINPFKINFNKLQNIYLDTLNTCFSLSSTCIKRIQIKSNIQELFLLKKDLPSISIEIFYLQINIFRIYDHICKSDYCCGCIALTPKYQKKKFILDLNSYFSKVINIEINDPQNRFIHQWIN